MIKSGIFEKEKLPEVSPTAEETGATEISAGGYGGFSWEDIFGGGFDGYGGGQSQQETTTEMQAARNYINAGHYREAMNVLNSIDSSQRGARWYYFHVSGELWSWQQDRSHERRRTGKPYGTGKYGISATS